MIELGVFILIHVILAGLGVLAYKLNGIMKTGPLAVMTIIGFALWLMMSSVPDIGWAEGGYNTTYYYPNGTVKEIVTTDAKTFYVIGDGDPSTTENQLWLAGVYMAMAFFFLILFFYVMLSDRIL